MLGSVGEVRAELQRFVADSEETERSLGECAADRCAAAVLRLQDPASNYRVEAKPECREEDAGSERSEGQLAALYLERVCADGEEEHERRCRGRLFEIDRLKEVRGDRDRA